MSDEVRFVIEVVDDGRWVRLGFREFPTQEAAMERADRLDERCRVVRVTSEVVAVYGRRVR